MSAPYSFLASSPDVLDAMFSLASGRGIVVNPSKPEIEDSFRSPVFPSERREFKDLLLSLEGGYPGIHLTHAEYTENPIAFGDGGKVKNLSFFLDIDGRHHLKPAGRVVASMTSELSRLKVPHWVKFSGSSGFHLHIPASAFPDKIDGVPFDEVAPRLFLELKHLLIRRAAGENRTDLLASIIHPKSYYTTSQGIQRSPFSRHETTGLLAIPLSDEEIPSFEPPRRGEIDPGDIAERTSILRCNRSSVDGLISALEDDREKPLPFYHRR
jgi:hypothetical protein